MGKGRLEAFSDGVLAIIITIMVLELKVPHGDTWASLEPLIPVLLSYVLSFIYVGIYWNNHHHMLQAVRTVNGRVLWANSFLLFWLSLVPFVTGWMGENHFSKLPVALYGFVLWMAGAAFSLLEHQLRKLHPKESVFNEALRDTRKETLSVILYPAGIALSFVNPWIGFAVYVLVAVIWFVPDQRFEKKAQHDETAKD